MALYCVTIENEKGEVLLATRARRNVILAIREMKDMVRASKMPFHAVDLWKVTEDCDAEEFTHFLECDCEHVNTLHSEAVLDTMTEEL